MRTAKKRVDDFSVQLIINVACVMEILSEQLVISEFSVKHCTCEPLFLALQYYSLLHTIFQFPVLSTLAAQRTETER